MELKPEYIGKRLLDKGFKIWFLYMFKAIEKRPFIVEPIHKGLFDYIDRVFKGETTRLNINVPPRAGKTTLAKYMVVYSLTKNPRSNIIYTSFSQSLLTDIANSVSNILENPVYKVMFPSNMRYESEEVNPIDDFWAEYLRKENGRNTYSSKRIVTAQGGTVIFSAIGGQITGYGAGERNAKGFSGALFIDDGNKPADIHSDVMRLKVVRYFEETLLSRLNNSNVPIINIQQRLHLEDLSGVLAYKYNFTTLKRPLIDENGVCQLPSQYSAERIEELKVNNYMFASQYQQEPIILGGGVIKREYWRYYQDANTNYKKIFITADTAMKTKEWNDFTAIGAWGVTMDNKLYLLDMMHAKLEAPELEQAMLAFWEKWRFGINNRSASAVYIEDKASGTGLVQSLKRRGGMPIIPIIPDKDKLERVNDVVPWIASGNVYLPFSENNAISKEVLAETDAFSADMSHKHDDIVDMITMAVKNAYMKRGLF